MQRDEIDPTKAISPQINRRAFVGIAAGAGAAAPVLAHSSAALGSAHPPFAAENDPRIIVEHPLLRVGTDEVDSYAAFPRHAAASTPSVVVVMHVWGVDVSIRDVVRRFALAGFCAIAPDLYARFHAPSGDGSTDMGVFRPLAKRLERTQYVADIAAAQSWLHAKFSATRSSLVGFCMGGRIALEASIDDGGRFVAVCPFYGPIENIDPNAVTLPVCGSYGGRDSSIPADSVRAFAAQLHVVHDIVIYDEAGHAFFDDQRSAYVASAADDAWRRTLRFLQRYGKPAA